MLVPTSRDLHCSDWHRPQYHFLPPTNWMNDPNGLIQWKGQYHLFYQHNPYGPLWGNMHWGHAVSEDLIHWRDLPIALAPTPGGPDEAGCYSGCAVNNNGVPTLVYTATAGARNELQTQCLATSDDDLLTWNKHPGNPVVSQVPEEAGQTSDFRDPFVWRECDAWYMAVGSGIKDVGGTVFLYRSPNLVDWEFLNRLLTGDIEHNGVIWECPNLFPLGDKWVLIVSAHLKAATGIVFYFVGSYENHRFVPVYESVLDYGSMYAPLSFVDDQGRRLLIGWLRESRSEMELLKAGWSGVQSIPRVLTLDQENRLNMVPVPELESIRRKHYHFEARAIRQHTVLGVAGSSLDIAAEFATGSDDTCGISLMHSSDKRSRVDIVFDAANQCLAVRTAQNNQVTQSREMLHTLAAGEPLKLRVLLDGSVVEIIANSRTSITSRIYPAQAGDFLVQLLGRTSYIQSLDIWEMDSIWRCSTR